MASTPDAFKARLIAAMGEVVDPSQLDVIATALSQAIHEYITQDVEVAAGQPVTTSTGAGATSGPGKLF